MVTSGDEKLLIDHWNRYDFVKKERSYVDSVRLVLKRGTYILTACGFIFLENDIISRNECEGEDAFLFENSNVREKTLRRSFHD